MSAAARRSHPPILAGLAIFAMAWAITRAAVQSITIDESISYMAFVRPTEVLHWIPASNNQILNSALMRRDSRM